MSNFPVSIVEFAEGEGHMHRNTHVVLTSGNHSDTYGNYRFLGADDYQEAREFYVRLLCDKVCEQMDLNANEIFWVGPQTMGAVMAGCLSRISYEAQSQVVDFLTLEKDGPDAFKHPEGLGHMNPDGKPVVFMDDVLTGGTNIKKAQPITDLIGGVKTVAVWMNRCSLIAGDLEVSKIIELDRIQARVWSPELTWMSGGPCKAGIPVRTDIGKPQAFLEAHPDYPTTTA